MTKNKNLKRIGLLLIGIVLFPVFFYTANEINSLDETEHMIKEIYERQMDALLFSVNQYTWDYLNDQISRAKELVNNPGYDLPPYFSAANPVKMINIYNMDLNLIRSIKSDEPINIAEIFMNDLPQYFRENINTIKNLVKNDSLGYQKIQTLSDIDFPSLSENFFISFFVMKDKNKQTRVIALLVNTSGILHQVIQPKLREISDNRFEVNIFYNKEINNQFSFTDLKYSEVIVEKSLWIFPKLSVGMRSLGQDVSEITQNRLNQSFVLIVILLVGLLSGALFIYRNIQKEIHLSELKSDFVSNVSHELRTPLSLIRMYAETLEMGRIKNEEKKMEYYKNISQESERLTHLINNILNFSGMESGKKSYNLQPVSLSEHVSKIIETYREHIYSNNFTLKIELDEKDGIINADPSAISEALINLLDNAIKYSNDIKKIEVSTGSENGMVYVSVKDFGIGIKAQNQKRIFEKFYRESSALVHNTKGSGLGLSLVKFIMNAHRGYVGLESHPGNGSCFTLFFPKYEV
jgi:two-component system phosphate regulon sensor histidine kinase PhoR